MNRQMLVAYGVCAVSFLALDACWLHLTTDRLYRPAIGALMSGQVDLAAAALLYALYFAGVVGFVIVPALENGSALSALVRGAAFGLVVYATYDLTNQATLRDWPWHLTLADAAWGSVATAIASAVACLVATRVN